MENKIVKKMLFIVRKKETPGGVARGAFGKAGGESIPALSIRSGERQYYMPLLFGVPYWPVETEGYN
jgi:hypothetical protein